MSTEPEVIHGLGILAAQYERTGDVHRVTVDVWGGAVNACGTVNFPYADAATASAALRQLRGWAQSGAVVKMIRTEHDVRLEWEAHGQP